MVEDGLILGENYDFLYQCSEYFAQSGLSYRHKFDTKWG
jgi:hypothetical protein